MLFTKVIKYVRELCYGPDIEPDLEMPVLVLSVPLPPETVPLFRVNPPVEVEVVLLQTPIPDKVIAQVKVKKPGVKPPAPKKKLVPKPKPKVKAKTKTKQKPLHW